MILSVVDLNMKDTRKTIPLSQLRGINIYFENDFYQAAKLVLKLWDARRERFNELGKARPTITGMIQIFAGLTDACNPKKDYVKERVVSDEIPLTGVIEFDHEP